MKFDNKNWPISFSPQFAILWYSIIAGVLAAALMASLVLNIESQERAHIDRVTQSSADGIKILLEENINYQIKALREVADGPAAIFSITSSQMTDKDWNTIIKGLFGTEHGYQAIVWVDGSFNIDKITPNVDPNPIKQKYIAIDFNSELKSPVQAAAIKAALSDTVEIKTVLHSFDGNLGLGIYVPVFKTTQSNKQLYGFIGGVLLFDSYIQKVIPSYLITEHQFTLYFDRQIVSLAPAKQLPMEFIWVKQASFILEDQKWRVDLAPKSEFLSQTYFRIMKILILLGALLSFFIAVAVYTGMIAVNKAKRIKDDRKNTKQLLQNLPGMAYQALNKKNWPMILVSEGCYKLTGYTKEEFEHHTVLFGNIIHQDDSERVCRVVNNAAKLKHAFELEYRIITRTNDIKLVWEKGESVCSSYNDDVIIEGFITDITSVKQVEVDLIDSDAFSETIVNSVVEAVITIDQKGLIKSFNNAAEKMFDYTSDEIKDHVLTALMPKLYADKHDHYLTQYLKTNQPHIIGSGRELVAKRKDGTTFPIHLSVSEFQNHKNRMFVGLIRDITQQRNAQDQMSIHTEQLAHADRLNALGEMAAGVAHEINQPLTAISLYSQTAKNFCKSSQFEKLPAIFDKISQQSRRAGAVLESVQIMTRQGDRINEIVTSQFLIKEVVNLSESEARLRDIKIRVITPFECSTVFVDRVQIQQVILNLLRNGMEAMQSIACVNGSVITLQAHLNSENYLEIAISDTGCGISKIAPKKLFTPFSSTKKNGTGIGLSISKRIVNEHGGDIGFYKNKPNGTVFFFTLPIYDQGNPNEK